MMAYQNVPSQTPVIFLFCLTGVTPVGGVLARVTPADVPNVVAGMFIGRWLVWIGIGVFTSFDWF